MPQLKISCHRKKYPNYRYFGRLLLRLTHAVSAKFLAKSIGSHKVKYFIPPWVYLSQPLGQIACFIAKSISNCESFNEYLIQVEI